MSKTLYMTIGLPASGKTTWAKQKMVRLALHVSRWLRAISDATA